MPQPLSRDLAETIRALEVTEAEFLFQADRLEGVREETQNEGEHLADLQEGYTRGARYARILINYHTGRMSRRGVETEPASPSIDARGRARAYGGNK